MYKYQLTSEEIKEGYQKENKILVFEDSSLSCHPCEHIYSTDRLGVTSIQIENTTTQNIVTFFFDSHDKSNGEVMGTRYKSRDGKLRLLIIND